MISGKRAPALAALLLILATGAAYWNSFDVPFVFDDVSSIVDNPTIRQLWPPGEALSPPSGWGFTVSGRPVLNYSLALNYALSGTGVRSYHALNLVIHLLAGLTLFGIVRRTLLQPSLPLSWREKSLPAAGIIAGLWLLHPLQTESVTYVIQRAESLMGLFFLLTLYAFIRALDSSRPRVWTVISFSACLLGVGTKEVAALTPVLVFLYDRTFVSGSFRAAWKRRRWRHLSLVATWIPLALLVAGTGGNRGGTVGFDVGVSLTGFWLTQFEALSRYLWLTFWPHPQVFEYGKVSAGSFLTVALWAVPVISLLAATLWALWKRPVAGFFGAWFFLLLAPTSLVPGKLQMIVEHRMYLPLAGLLAGALGTAALRCRPRAFLAIGISLLLVAGTLTVRRNALYRDERRLWEDVLVHRPANARAHNNLGLLLYREGRLDEAIAHYREAARLDPTEAHTQYNLGLALMKAGHPREAIAHLEESVRILPYYFNAHLNLGIVLTQLGQPGQALPHLAEAIRFDPSPAIAHFQTGLALAALNRWDDAATHYAEAVRLDPNYAEALSNWGVALFRQNAVPAAIERFESALRLKPDSADVHYNLGLAFAQQRRAAEAATHYAEAVRLNPAQADAQLNLGIALAQTGKLADALPHLEEAARLRPDFAEAHTSLALALLDLNRPAEAIAHYETALQLRPDDPRAHYNLGYAQLVTGHTREARIHFENALKLQPTFAPARDLLQQLRTHP